MNKQLNSSALQINKEFNFQDLVNSANGSPEKIINSIEIWQQLTDEIKKVVAEGVEDESVTEEEISEVADEVVEEEVEVAEAKVKEEEEDEKDSDDEEEVDESSEEDEEEDEDEVEEIAIPKTKAGVINAALEMLKKAKKNEAQQLFAKMVKQVSKEILAA